MAIIEMRRSLCVSGFTHDIHSTSLQKYRMGLKPVYFEPPHCTGTYMKKTDFSPVLLTSHFYFKNFAVLGR